MSTTSRSDDVILDKSDLQVCESKASAENISLGTEEKMTASEKETKPLPAADDLHILLKEQLDLLQCPFTWNLRSKSDLNVSHMEEKLKEIGDDGMFHWRRFILNLAICNENYWKCDYPNAFEHQRTCEEIAKVADSDGPYEIFYKLIKDALLHVTLACKCYLLFKTGLVKEVTQILQSICGFEDMVSSCQAAIWGIRAAYAMEFGYEGTKSAIKFCEKALEFDSKQGEWYFLLGKSLGRIRRIDAHADIPEHRELKALETAVQLTENPSHIIFLAQAYREAAFKAFSVSRNNLKEQQKSIFERMNQQSADLYKKALELRSDCTHINVRCAQGFFKLPYPHKNIELAKECCNKALNLAPNNAMVNHVAGNIAERFENDLEKAKKHYEIAGEQGAFGAYMDLFRLKYNEDSNYNPISDLERVLNHCTEVPRTEETLCQMGSFCFFIQNDLATAVREYWSKVIEQNPESDKLKNHKCGFLHMKTTVNIYDCMFDEARLALQNNTAGENLGFFQKIILDHTNKFPDSVNSTPKERRKIVWDEATNVDHSRSRPRRGRGRGRGCRNQSWRQEDSRGGRDWRAEPKNFEEIGRYRHDGSNSSIDSRTDGNHGYYSQKHGYQRTRNDSTSSLESSSDFTVSRTRENKHYDRSNRHDEQHTYRTWRTASNPIQRDQKGRHLVGGDRNRNGSESEERTDASNSNSLRNWREGCLGGDKNMCKESGRKRTDSLNTDTQRDRKEGYHGYSNKSRSSSESGRNRKDGYSNKSISSSENGRKRTDSSNTDTRSDWKEGYHGYANKSRSSSESGRQTQGSSRDTCRDWKKGCLDDGEVKNKICTENNDNLQSETASESSRRKDFNSTWKGVDDSQKGFLRGPIGRIRNLKISDYSEEANGNQDTSQREKTEDKTDEDNFQ